MYSCKPATYSNVNDGENGTIVRRWGALPPGSEPYGTWTYPTSRDDVLEKSRSSGFCSPKIGQWRDPTPRSGYVRRRVDSLPFTLYGEKYGLYWYESDWNLQTAPTLSTDNPSGRSWAVNASQSDALEALAEARVDLSVAFLERKQTADMLVDAINGVIDFGRNLRRGKIRWHGRAFERKFLESKYGWMPSLMDVYGSAELLAAADAGVFDRYVITGKGRRRIGWETEYEATSSSDRTMYGSHKMEGQLATEIGYTLEAYTRLDCSPANSFYLTLQAAGLHNPFLTLYEITSMSFVLDWFVNFGGWLNAVNALRHYELKGGTTTVWWKRSGSSIWRRTPSSAWSNVGGPAEVAGYSSNEAFDRAILSDPPIVVPVINRDVFDMSRVATSLALLSQVFASWKV